MTLLFGAAFAGPLRAAPLGPARAAAGGSRPCVRRASSDRTARPWPPWSRPPPASTRPAAGRLSVERRRAFEWDPRLDKIPKVARHARDRAFASERDDVALAAADEARDAVGRSPAPARRAAELRIASLEAAECAAETAGRDRRRRADPRGRVPDADPGVARRSSARSGCAPRAASPERRGALMSPAARAAQTRAASPRVYPAARAVRPVPAPWSTMSATATPAPTVTPVRATRDDHARPASRLPALEAAARRRRELREALVAFEDALSSPVRDRVTWQAEVADAPRGPSVTRSRTTSRRPRRAAASTKRCATSAPQLGAEGAAASATSIRRSPRRLSRHRPRLAAAPADEAAADAARDELQRLMGRIVPPPPARRRPGLGGLPGRIAIRRRLTLVGGRPFSQPARSRPARTRPRARLLAGGRVVVIDGGLATELEHAGPVFATVSGLRACWTEQPEAIVAAHLGLLPRRSARRDHRQLPGDPSRVSPPRGPRPRRGGRAPPAERGYWPARPATRYRCRTGPGGPGGRCCRRVRRTVWRRACMTAPSTAATTGSMRMHSPTFTANASRYSPTPVPTSSPARRSRRASRRRRSSDLLDEARRHGVGHASPAATAATCATATRWRKRPRWPTVSREFVAMGVNCVAPEQVEGSFTNRRRPHEADRRLPEFWRELGRGHQALAGGDRTRR